jgi:co-chaperonin GroES (HSP10)
MSGEDWSHIEPLHDQVLIRIIPKGKTAAGIIIPSSAEQRDRALVLAIGPGSYQAGQRIPVCNGRVQPGDIVLLSPRPVGTMLKKDPDGFDVVSVRHEEVVMRERTAEEVAALRAPRLEVAS